MMVKFALTEALELQSKIFMDTYRIQKLDLGSLHAQNNDVGQPELASPWELFD